MLVIKGNALWTKVFEPDTRFVPEGEYSIQVVVPETEAAEVCEQLENMAQAKLAEVVKEQPKLKNVLSMCSNLCCPVVCCSFSFFMIFS